MLESKNQNIEPMKGRRNQRRAAGVRLMVSFLTERHPVHERPSEPVSTLRIPGTIGSVALPREYSILDEPYREIALEPLTQPLAEHGFNWSGDYV